MYQLRVNQWHLLVHIDKKKSNKSSNKLSDSATERTQLIVTTCFLCHSMF